MEKVAAELPVIAAKGANGDTTLSFVTRDEGILYEDNHIHIRLVDTVEIKTPSRITGTKFIELIAASKSKRARIWAVST